MFTRSYIADLDTADQRTRVLSLWTFTLCLVNEVNVKQSPLVGFVAGLTCCLFKTIWLAFERSIHKLNTFLFLKHEASCFIYMCIKYISQMQNMLLTLNKFNYNRKHQRYDQPIRNFFFCKFTPNNCVSHKHANHPRQHNRSHAENTCEFVARIYM